MKLDETSSYRALKMNGQHARRGSRG